MAKKLRPINPPYFVKFSPPTTTDDNASIIWNWVLTAQAVSIGRYSLVVQ